MAQVITRNPAAATARAPQPAQTGIEVNPQLVGLRLATEADAAQIAELYAPYAAGVAVNFEYEAPNAEEFAARIRLVQRRFPFIVATHPGPDGERIIGYTFARPMGDRPAFAWSADPSIYLRRECRGRHLGPLLYEALEPILKYQGIVELFSSVTVSASDDLADLDDPAARERTLARVHDPHLPATSPRFHRSQGYVPVGREYGIGYKLGTWYDKLWMQKHLRSPRPERPEPVIALPDVPRAVIDDALEGALRAYRERAAAAQ